MPPGRKKPDVALSRVPSIGELCNRLGFQQATPTETSIFTDTTHAFRKSYKCSDGSPGSELVGWYSVSVQQELTAMALAFLAERGNGERFWSDARRWRQDGDLTYPEDKKIIADLLKQLFWKQNKYALNNQTYIDKKVTESRDISRDNTTPIHETTQRASMVSASTVKPSNIDQHQTYDVVSRPSSSYIAVQRGPVISLLDEEREQLADTMQRITSTTDAPSQSRDIFEFPEDDIDRTRDPPADEYTSDPAPIRTPKKSSQSRNEFKSPSGKRASGTSPLSKRPKIAAKVEKNPKKRKLISPRRASGRQKVSRTFPDAAPQKIVDDMMRTEFPEDFPDSAADKATGRTIGRPQDSSATASPYDMMREFSNDHKSIHTTESRFHKSKQSAVPLAPMVAPSIRDGFQPSKTYSIPSTTSEPLSPLQLLPDLMSTPDPTATKPKPKVRGLFWIITSPEPNYNEETWKNGQIKGKSLSDVIKEISSITHRDGIEKLKILLKTAFVQTTTTVQNDADDHWEIIKSNMEEKIRDAFARERERQNHFQIWIEPIYGLSAPMGRVALSVVEDIDW